MVTALFMANYKSANQNAVLNAAADKLAGDLRLMQSYALGAKKLQNDTVPAGGWCINFFSPKTSYILFSDINGDSDYDNGEKFKDVVLTSQLEIKGGAANGRFEIFLPAGGQQNRNQMDICYQPPDPAVSFVGYTGGALITGGIASAIVVRNNSTGKEKKILLNSFGLIDVE